MNKFKNALVCSIVVSLSGCGTVNTVIRGDSVARHNLNQIETACRTIPRIYSGISYDICILRGKPSHTSLWLGSAPQLMFIDLVLSGALDTVALPYTIYEQINKGHINLR
ncbi:MAG: YceK/YidQ family lipoprotein [Pseudomonadota bacterium]